MKLKNSIIQESSCDEFKIQPNCLFGLVSCKESYLLAYSWWTLAFELSGPLHTYHQLYTTVTQSKAPLQIHVDFFARCKCGVLFLFCFSAAALGTLFFKTYFFEIKIKFFFKTYFLKQFLKTIKSRMFPLFLQKKKKKEKRAKKQYGTTPYFVFYAFKLLQSIDYQNLI